LSQSALSLHSLHRRWVCPARHRSSRRPHLRPRNRRPSISHELDGSTTSPDAAICAKARSRRTSGKLRHLATAPARFVSHPASRHGCSGLLPATSNNMRPPPYLIRRGSHVFSPRGRLRRRSCVHRRYCASLLTRLADSAMSLVRKGRPLSSMAAEVDYFGREDHLSQTRRCALSQLDARYSGTWDSSNSRRTGCQRVRRGELYARSTYPHPR